MSWPAACESSFSTGRTFGKALARRANAPASKSLTTISAGIWPALAHPPSMSRVTLPPPTKPILFFDMPTPHTLVMKANTFVIVPVQ